MDGLLLVALSKSKQQQKAQKDQRQRKVKKAPKSEFKSTLRSTLKRQFFWNFQKSFNNIFSFVGDKDLRKIFTMSKRIRVRQDLIEITPRSPKKQRVHPESTDNETNFSEKYVFLVYSFPVDFHLFLSLLLLRVLHL